VLLPGTISGDSHAIFKMYMRPIDFSLVGTIHSHPSYSFYSPSAYLRLFQKFGKVHIITVRPFNINSWRVYNYIENEIDIEII
jgi:proteasome lid subunit RPN8/RPN11